MIKSCVRPLTTNESLLSTHNLHIYTQNKLMGSTDAFGTACAVKSMFNLQNTSDKKLDLFLNKVIRM